MAKLIQVTNIAPQATKEQMSTLFGFIGKIEDIKLYPSEDSLVSFSTRVCYVKYEDSPSVGVAQHLTNTVFIDRALIIVPIADENIPSEERAMAIAAPGSAVAGYVPSGLPKLGSNITSQIENIGGSQYIITVDPNLTALGLPQYPPLSANIDPTKIEEIRRTVFVGNLDTVVSADEMLQFFNQIGEVKYVRMAGDELQSTRFAFVEFTEQTSVAAALQYNGVVFGGRPLKINHSNNAIVKPQPKSIEAAQREIEDAMKKVRDAQSLITAAIEPELGRDKRRRSGSRSRRRSRSRSKGRSHSKHSSRSSRRSGSRARRRSRSRSKGRGRRSRSRSKGRRPRSRSQSKGRRRKSRSRSKKKSRSRSKEKKSMKSRSPLKKKSRSRTPSKSSSKSSKSKDKDKEKSKRKSPELKAAKKEKSSDDSSNISS